jgi:hypothetical protein
MERFNERKLLACMASLTQVKKERVTKYDLKVLTGNLREELCV